MARSTIDRLWIGVLALALAGCRTPIQRRAEAPATSGSALEGAEGTTLMPPPAPAPADSIPPPKIDDQRAAQVHLDLGRVFEAKEQLGAAEGSYRRALEAAEGRVDRPTKALVHRRLAAALDRQGKFGDAEPHHKAAMTLAPDDPRCWNDAGYSAYLQGRLDEAVANLQHAARLDPSDARTQTNLGLALAASSRDDEALAAFGHAGGPSAAEANLAYIQAASGRTEDAKGHYQRALQFNPRLAIAQTAIERLDAAPAAPAAPASTLLADDGPMAPVDPAVSTASLSVPSAESTDPAIAEPSPERSVRKPRLSLPFGRWYGEPRPERDRGRPDTHR